MEQRAGAKTTPHGPTNDGLASAPVVRSFGRTDVGRVRQSNEDHFLIAELARTLLVQQTSLPQPEMQVGHRRGHLYLIADGMGGHRGGEVASALTVTTLEQFMLDVFRKAEDFHTALQQAHARILEEAARHPEVSDMGTTLTMAVANNWRLFVTHAGDSRCSIFRAGRLTQITTDHTVVGELVRGGVVKPADAAHSPFRHVVTNAVGAGRSSVKVEVQEVTLQPEDVLLLSSDGLTDMVPNDRISAILADDPDPRHACDRLVDEALARGGRDNVTVIVSHFAGPSASS
jgi:protein phosphatase